MSSALAGLALEYKIYRGATQGSPGKVIEVAFGQPPVKGGVSIAYGNFLCQHKDRDCVPYLDREGTAEEYGEDVPDPGKILTSGLEM